MWFLALFLLQCITHCFAELSLTQSGVRKCAQDLPQHSSFWSAVCPHYLSSWYRGDIPLLKRRRYFLRLLLVPRSPIGNSTSFIGRRMQVVARNPRKVNKFYPNGPVVRGRFFD